MDTSLVHPAPMLDSPRLLTPEIDVGNVTGTEAQDTLCPGCDRVLIHRTVLGVINNNIESGNCPDCGLPLAGVEMRREN